MERAGKAAPGGFLRRHTRVGAPLVAGEGVAAGRIALECEARNGRDHRTETQFILAQPLLGAYQIVNVRERASPSNDPSLRIASRLRAVEEPAVASVRRPYAALYFEGPARSHGGVPLIQYVLGLVWMVGSDKPRHGALLRRHARVCAPLVAGEDVRAIRIGFVRKIWNRRDHCAETQFARAQRFLGSILLGDVYASADLTKKVAAARESRDAMIQYPAVLAVIAPQTILHLKWFPRLEARDIYFQAAIVILRMNTLCPPVTQFLFYHASGEVEPRFVEECAESVRPGDPDHDRRRVRQNTELFLARAQRLFGPFPLDALCDRSRDSGDSFDRVFAQWMTREHRHHPDDPILNQQRIAREGHHSFLSRPLRVADARVITHVVGQMRLALFGDQANLEFPDGHAGVPAIQVRIHSCAGLQFQQRLLRIQRPDARKRRVQMSDQRFSALLQHTLQGRLVLGQSGAHVCAQSRPLQALLFHPLALSDVRQHADHPNRRAVAR